MHPICPTRRQFGVVEKRNAMPKEDLALPRIMDAMQGRPERSRSAALRKRL